VALTRRAAGAWPLGSGQRVSPISVTVEDGYRLIIMRGTARLAVDAATAQEDIRQLAVRYHGKATANRQVREQLSKQERVSIYLAADRVTMNGF
jgi:hypothetical protein